MILLGVGYTSAVFHMPEQADKVAQIAWAEQYNEFVRSFKSTLDDVTTDIPSKNEFVEGSKAALSGALDIKDTVVNGISTTKDTIDTVRWTLSGAESTYNEAKDTFNQAKDFVEGASEKMQNVKETLDDVENLGNSITNMVNTENVDVIIQDTAQ